MKKPQPLPPPSSKGSVQPGIRISTYLLHLGGCIVQICIDLGGRPASWSQPKHSHNVYYIYIYYDTWGTPNTLWLIKPKADFLIKLIQNLRSLTMAKWLKIEPSDIAHSIRNFFSFSKHPLQVKFRSSVQFLWKTDFYLKKLIL